MNQEIDLQWRMYHFRYAAADRITAYSVNPNDSSVQTDKLIDDYIWIDKTKSLVEQRNSFHATRNSLLCIYLAAYGFPSLCFIEFELNEK